MNGQQKYQPTTLAFELVEAGGYNSASSISPAKVRYNDGLSNDGFGNVGFRPALFL